MIAELFPQAIFLNLARCTQRNGVHEDHIVRPPPFGDLALVEGKQFVPRKIHLRLVLGDLFSSPTLIWIYVASGLQLFINGGMLAWLPSFLNRTYDMPVSKAGGVAAIFVLCAACGMPLCGALVDRVGRDSLRRKIFLTMGFNLACASLVFAAFQLPAGTAQLVLIALGLFFSAGIVGPSGTMVAKLTPKAIHSTAMATLALTYNIIGLAPGSIVTGALADRLGLAAALQLLPIAGIASASVLLIGVRFMRGDQ